MNEVVKSKYGFYSVKKMPTKEELSAHYSEKYYQEESVQYSHQYSDDELKHFQYIADVARHVYSYSYDSKNKSFLDVGSGEGFFASNFYENNWNVTTMDYSDYGIATHNPHLKDTLMQGDVFNSLDNCVTSGKKYNFINLSNILEHVLNPISLLQTLKSLLSDESLLRISVPNDYSDFQMFLMDKGYTSETWLCPPDHLHYFTFNSLSNLLLSLEYDIVLSMGEFPIELFLSNESSNYTKDRSVGKYAHKSRIEVDNFLFEQGIEKYINYYKASADIGMSRQVVIYAKVKEK